MAERIVALNSARATILASIATAETDADVKRLCSVLDGIGAQMVDLPVNTLADAHAKLAVVAGLYTEAIHRDGHDLTLFRQVLAWMDGATS